MHVDMLYKLRTLVNNGGTTQQEKEFIKDVAETALLRAEMGVVTGFSAEQVARVDEIYARQMAEGRMQNALS